MLNQVVHRITPVIKMVNYVLKQKLYTCEKQIYLTTIHVTGYTSATRVKYS